MIHRYAYIYIYIVHVYGIFIYVKINYTYIRRSEGAPISRSPLDIRRYVRTRVWRALSLCTINCTWRSRTRFVDSSVLLIKHPIIESRIPSIRCIPYTVVLLSIRENCNLKNNRLQYSIIFNGVIVLKILQLFPLVCMCVRLCIHVDIARNSHKLVLRRSA